MGGWWALFQKDFRMGAPWLLTGLSILIGIDLTSIWFVENPDLKKGIFFFTILVHYFYFSIFLLSNLEQESKQLHQWLHSSQPAWKLLASKILAALSATILSFSIGCFYPVWYLFQEGFLPKIWEDITQTIGIILLSSLSFGFLLMVVWMIQQGLKSHIGKWSGLVFVFYFVIFNFLTNVVTTQSHIQNENGWSFTINLYWTSWVFHLTTVVLSFLLATWLLERKTEV
ncbi:hypothetical protein [Melghirimyces algeriensis]|uniref:ABC-2 type transport system permease protein n=1 Tax=Melghirimyces algeriensis TaxID=910412 RepID=A0A521CQ52_9BACL|nr:hypothetical protein [Melghirimyces algeriensis]SMO61577.1 hypothetical protein SAMN06264849_104118 [Melghirimyces algeriensis]